MKGDWCPKVPAGPAGPAGPAPPAPTSWSRSLKRVSWICADSEAPMPPVFMHSSTMIALRMGGRAWRGGVSSCVMHACIDSELHALLHNDRPAHGGEGAWRGGVSTHVTRACMDSEHTRAVESMLGVPCHERHGRAQRRDAHSATRAQCRDVHSAAQHVQ